MCNAQYFEAAVSSLLRKSKILPSLMRNFPCLSEINAMQNLRTEMCPRQGYMRGKFIETVLQFDRLGAAMVSAIVLGLPE
jgi:hypothetical protein